MSVNYYKCREYNTSWQSKEKKMCPEKSLITNKISHQVQNSVENLATSFAVDQDTHSVHMDLLIKTECNEDEDANCEAVKQIKITQVRSVKEEPTEVEECESLDFAQNARNKYELGMEATSVKEEKTENEKLEFFSEQVEGGINAKVVLIKKEPVDKEEHEACGNDVSFLAIKEESIEKVFIKEELSSLVDENVETEQSRFPIQNENDTEDICPVDFNLMKIKEEVEENETEITHSQENGNARIALSSWHVDNQESSGDQKLASKEEYAFQPLVSYNTKGCHKCEVCGKLFKRLSTFKSHILFHVKAFPHECNYCSLRFRLLCDLQKHELIHSDKYSKCNICGRICKNQGYLKLHSVIHSNKVFNCKVCGKEFTKPEKLNGHMACHKHHHECKKCGKIFKLKLLLKNHIVTHNSKSKDVKIPQKTKQNLQVSTRHHECNICKRNFQRLNALKSHLNTHKNPKSEVQECKVCNKKFTSLSSLQKHVQIHVDECPYECKICGKKFTCSYSLREHTHVHKGKDQNQCTFCKKTFKDSNSFSLHVCMDSFIVLYECEICSDTFQSRDELEKHSHSHKNKSYECMICSKHCADLRVLKRHVRVHVEDGFHECMICGKTYRHIESLKRHVISHTSEFQGIKLED